MSNHVTDKEPSCVNCGGPGHWAIACPEPTRDVPAGLRAKRRTDDRQRGNDKHSLKRHRGPVVNKYGPPPPPSQYQNHPPAPTPPPPSHYANHPPHPSPTSYPPYGGEPSYFPPVPPPRGQYGQYPSRGPAPPGPSPSFSPPPQAAGGPYSAPPYGHPYHPPDPYGGRHPAHPPPPHVGPHGHTTPPQHHHQTYHQPPQQHPPPYHHTPSHPPPPHHSYPPSPAYSLPPHPALPTPHPHTATPPAGHGYHGTPPSSLPPPPLRDREPYPPSYGRHGIPPPMQHHSPPPPPPAQHSHGYPTALPTPPSIGPSSPFNPASLIRVLPPKPVTEPLAADRGHNRRKERNKNWKNKKSKDEMGRQPPSTTKPDANRKKDTAKKHHGRGDHEPKLHDGQKRGKDSSHHQEKESRKSDGSVESGEAATSKTEPDAASKVSDQPEEGEIAEEEAGREESAKDEIAKGEAAKEEKEREKEKEETESEWDERTIFQEPEGRHPADAVAGPLPADYTDAILLPPAWDAKCVDSEFVKPGNEEDFCRPLVESSLWHKYNDAPPFRSRAGSTQAGLSNSPLLKFLETRRSSENPGPRREPNNRRDSFDNHSFDGYHQARGGADEPSTANRGGYRRSASPDWRTQSNDRRQVIDSYRPKYRRDRSSRSPSPERARPRGGSASSRGRRSPSGNDRRPSPYFELPMGGEREREREGSVESDLNSLENELLGLSPKSSSPDDDAEEKDRAAEKKGEGSPPQPSMKKKKRPNDDAIPKNKRRRVQVNSAFSLRW